MENESRLSRIETLWSMVHRSHAAEDSISTTAQQQLLDIYGGAIRRYLIASLRDIDLAEDLFQEFALKFVKGDFRNVDPAKGKFRHFVKTVVRNLIYSHHRKTATRKEQIMAGDAETDITSNLEQSADDEIFLRSWRGDLLEQTWQALENHEQETGVTYNTVLRLRVTEPAISSDEFAKKLSERLGKEISSGTARVSLHRAREKFATLMIKVVAESLVNPCRESIESELVDLGLIDYCRDTLESYEV